MSVSSFEEGTIFSASDPSNLGEECSSLKKESPRGTGRGEVPQTAVNQHEHCSWEAGRDPVLCPDFGVYHWHPRPLFPPLTSATKTPEKQNLISRLFRNLVYNQPTLQQGQRSTYKQTKTASMQLTRKLRNLKFIFKTLVKQGRHPPQKKNLMYIYFTDSWVINLFTGT